MTVCIAAVCDSGKAIVVAADRMFTNPGLSLEFETEEKKTEELGATCVALSSGNSVFATEVLDQARRELSGNRTPEFAKLFDVLKKAYISVRAEKAEAQVITPPLGADYIRNSAKGVSLPAYLERQGSMYQQLAMMQSQFSLNVEFIVAGIDGRGAHISQVSNPGFSAPLDKLGYAIIGSGALHALIRLSMVGQTSRRGLVETLSDVYNAKRVSEVAPGVGKATDLAIVDDKWVHYCGERTMQELELIYQSVTTRLQPDLVALRNACDAERAAN